MQAEHRFAASAAGYRIHLIDLSPVRALIALIVSRRSR
jgi:hypothetical protein